MEQILLKAVTTATDEGTFTAVISTASVDRDGDIVEPVALVRALQKWAALGKRVPLAWSHAKTTDANGDVHYVTVGSIDPKSARVVGSEVIAEGHIDQEAKHGSEAWRLVKSGTLSFSYGYLVPVGGATKRQGATRGLHIKEIDIFEISIVPIGPANNDTRVLGWKAQQKADAAEAPSRNVLDWVIDRATEFIAKNPDEDAQIKALLETLNELGNEDKADTGEKAMPGYITVQVPVDQAWLLPADELAAVAQRMIDTKSVDGAGRRHQTRSADPLRARADAVALDFLSDGESGRKPPAKQEVQKPAPQLALNELRQRMRDETLIALSGVDEL